MTTGAARAVSIRTKLLLLFAGPLVVALAAGFGGRSDLLPSAKEELDRHERQLHTAFAETLEEARRVARAGLEGTPERTWREVQQHPGRLGRRIEGIGLLTPAAELGEWSGTPADPPVEIADPARSGWAVRVDGVRTRLFARAGPDDRGRLALVSVLLDSTLEDLSFHDLLPQDFERRVRIQVAFDGDAAANGAPESRRVTLRSPDGDALGIASLSPTSRRQSARRIRIVGRAWAAVLFVVLLAAFFEWKKVTTGTPGLLLTVAAISVARTTLLWQEVPGTLLPRALGSPSLFGSSKLWGLLASPADLLLTGAAIYLLCASVLAYCSGAAARRRVAVALCLLVATAVTASVAGLAGSLVRNSRVALLERPAPFEWDARLALWLGLLLPLLGAAELWSSNPAIARSTDRGAANSPVSVGLVAVLLCAGVSVLMQRGIDRLAVDQLRSEYVPQVLEQEDRRRLALTGTMAVLQETYASDVAWDDSHPEFLAYRHWVGSELFHSRYKSSLDFYSANGEPIDHFGFGLPPLDEEIPSDDLDGEMKVKEEDIDLFDPRPHLLHAELPLYRDGKTVAIAVGHVLDEPDNLPFLPWSQTYLSALGPGILRSVPQAPGGNVQYVLYDEFRGVTVTTLLQPPAMTDSLRAAADEGETLEVRAGEEPYLAVAIGEDDARVHLLLLPEWTLAERLGAIVRLSLLALSVLGFLVLLTRVLRPGGIRALLPVVRGSFYRKLLAALLLASIVPLVGLALFLRGYLERRADDALIAAATQFVSTAQRVVEDYSADAVEGEALLNDYVLYWLRRIVGQEIHVFRDGVLQASSTRELFDSGLLPPRLDGDVLRRLVADGLPYLVGPMSIGPTDIPVAYAPIRQPGMSSQLVVAVPLVLEQRQIARGVSRVAEMILLATVALVGLLAVAAALLARTVARPVRDLVEATGQIAAGDYATRLEPETEDEVAELVDGFNTMAAALARQRADLERRRDYIETLLRHATIGVISLDRQGRVVTLNPAAAGVLATLPVEPGAGLDEVLEASKAFRPLARALREAPVGAPVDADLATDEPRRLRGVRVELANVAGERFGTLILLEDITELMRSNQLAAWAEMARAIAHEIKNPLTPIQLSAEHLARLLDDRPAGPTEGERACIETIIKQVRALYDIAGEFSAYAKLPVLAPEPTDPVAFMQGVVSPYRASSPPGVTIDECYDRAPLVAVDPKVLTRAVVNLIENALHAMPDGGTLTVGVGPGRNGGVELSVRDTGTGLDPQVRRRLFEPYFSTKSSGTGLGLAIVRRVVEAHGGTIDVSSEPQRGTTFRISIPSHGG